MSEEIKHVKLSFACAENWDAMTQTEAGRHCDQCQKKVYDFTNGNSDELKRVLAENNYYKVCIRFLNQMTSTPIVLPFWRRWLSAAMVVIGFNILGNNAIAQHTKHKQAKQKVTTSSPAITTDGIQLAEHPKAFPSTDSLNNIKLEERAIPKSDSTNYFFGMVSDIPPEFPGGYEKFKVFINKNLDQTKSQKAGRINITFVVEKDGSLSDVKAIGRIFDQNAADEASRVVKLSPKWIPGKQNDKPVRVQYTVPIVFN